MSGISPLNSTSPKATSKSWLIFSKKKVMLVAYRADIHLSLKQLALKICIGYFYAPEHHKIEK